MSSIERLEPFVGEWSVEMEFPPEVPIENPVVGRTTFELILDDEFLLQRAEVDNPDAPNGTMVISPDPDSGVFQQHYFDARGVVRVYSMTFTDAGVWTLLRVRPDFSQLSFSQRFTGQFSDDRNAIEGRWEKCDDGASWELDFEMAYTRIEAA